MPAVGGGKANKGSLKSEGWSGRRERDPAEFARMTRANARMEEGDQEPLTISLDDEAREDRERETY